MHEKNTRLSTTQQTKTNVFPHLFPLTTRQGNEVQEGKEGGEAAYSTAVDLHMA